MDSSQRYSALDDDGRLRTRNILMRVDRHLRFIDQREMQADLTPVRDSDVLGLEDCRLFGYDGRVWFTCTTTDLHPGGPVRMSLCALNDAGVVDVHRPLHGYGDDRPQKNWLPFVDPCGRPMAIYGYDPLVVVGIDVATGRCDAVIERSPGRPLGLFRGSAGPVDLPPRAGGGRLVLVHGVAVHHVRYYLHRLLHFDAEWRLVAASGPFYFLMTGVEFACGACLSHDGRDLLITFGVGDHQAWLCRLPVATAASLLRPLPDWPTGSSAHR
jgi:hypothetical protein